MKKQPTFAERAKAIQAKYKRAKFDPVEKKDMEAELDSLIEEQEAFKASKGYGGQQPGVQQFSGTGPSYIKPLNLTDSFKQELVISPKMQVGINTSKQRGILQNLPKGGDSTTFLPTAIGAGATALGNLFLANQAKKLYNPISSTVASVDKINLEPKAEQLRRDATTTRRSNILNARNLGTNAGEIIANVAAGNAGVDRNLGANLTDLYMNQEQFNVGASNQASMFNAQNKSRTDMFNSQSKSQAQSESLDYLSGALSVPGNAMREVQMIKADEKNKRLLENYYKTIGGQHYSMLNSLYGVNPFEYKVNQ